MSVVSRRLDAQSVPKNLRVISAVQYAPGDTSIVSSVPPQVPTHARGTKPFTRPVSSPAGTSVPLKSLQSGTAPFVEPAIGPYQKLRPLRPLPGEPVSAYMDAEEVTPSYIPVLYSQLGIRPAPRPVPIAAAMPSQPAPAMYRL